MESRIPLPTDSIFKFYALFGLLLFVFSFGASLYNTKSTNEFVTAAYVESETLKAVVAPSAAQVARLEVLKRLLEVTTNDKQFFKWGCALLCGIGTALMLFGFGKWHREIQPIQDETASLQLRKLRVEVARLEYDEGERIKALAVSIQTTPTSEQAVMQTSAPPSLS